MSVSSRSSTKQYEPTSDGSSGSRNGGDTLGRFVKLFGNTAELVDAIADAFRIANGFFPVRLVCPPLPIILLAPELVFSFSEPADLAAAP